jgi:hypothetical protein
VSEQSTGAAPGAPSGSTAGRRENVFTHKIGPLPMWGWLAIVAAALIGWRLYSNKTNAAAQQQQQGTPTDTSANTVPQFVNQTYVSTSAPIGTGGQASTPTNPSPVGDQPGSQPKPTTTIAGWHYPAPTGLKTDYVATRGVRLSWNAVTGPAGQHPNNYMVATYNSKGKLVNEHGTVGGNTSTDEYGPGGRGLPKGVYHTQVWANGGPIAPPGSTVQYTLKG